MVEVVIDSIRVSLMNYQRVVILKEKESDRYLPIWIGPAEADAIAVKLQDVKLPRPLTHDLLCSIMEILGANVDFILVNDLRNDTFYAKIMVNFDGQEMEIDSRPSDAIALAVRIKAPIYVEDIVLDRAGIIFDKETGKPMPAGSEFGDKDNKPSEEELRRLSAFTDFINTLDLEGLDRDKTGSNEPEEDSPENK
jgi:bifunctional DNase/RNase